MVYKRNGKATIQEEKSKRQIRAERILNVAAELTLRWGYQKTTIDDIARQAGVAKGTIYLHWKTREELFLAMILRDQFKMAEVLLEQLSNDPEGVLPHAITRHSLMVLEQFPLIKAILLEDTSLLGDLLLNSPLASSLTAQKMQFFEGYFQYLRNQGLLRTDSDIQVQVYQFSAIVTGFLTIEQFLPERYHHSVEAMADLAALSVKQIFAPQEPISPLKLAEAQQEFQQTIHQYLAVIKQQVQKEMEV